MRDVLNVCTPPPANDDDPRPGHVAANEGQPPACHDTDWFGREWVETEMVDDATVLVTGSPTPRLVCVEDHRR